MPDPIVEAHIRAQRFWYRDGLTDIALGIIILLQNGLTLVMHFGNDKSSWYSPVIWTYLLLFCGLAAFSRRIMTAMRERIVYPRSGYVDPGEYGRKFRIAVVALTILAIVAMFLACCYAGCDLGPGIQWIPLLGGLFISAVGVYVGVRYNVLRYLWVGLFSIALGLALKVEYPSSLGVDLWFVGVGCACLCSGGIALWNFVRITPVPSEAR